MRAIRDDNGLDERSRSRSTLSPPPGSGLDPHISVANARLQAPRVAGARDLALDEVLQLIDAHTDGRAFGFLGEPGVKRARAEPRPRPDGGLSHGPAGDRRVCSTAGAGEDGRRNPLASRSCCAPCSLRWITPAASPVGVAEGRVGGVMFCLLVPTVQIVVVVALFAIHPSARSGRVPR